MDEREWRINCFGMETGKTMGKDSWINGKYPFLFAKGCYMNIIVRNYESQPDVWPQNKCRSLWPLFHGPLILPCILKTVWCMNIILWDYESVWPNVWSQNKCRSLWPIFHGPLILPYNLKTVWFGIMSRYDPTFDLKINVGHCDLYFMIQWFCHIFPRPFDGWVSYFQIMRHCDPNFVLQINIGQHFMV